MPIIKKIRKHDPDTHRFLGYEEKRLFEGRVLRVEHRSEHRNVSDTLDYSDWQTITATWALVWLGTHGAPPSMTTGRPVTGAEVYSWERDRVRELTIGEQYAWIDCSNVFADRNGFALNPEVDSFDMQLLHGGPEMIEGVAAWETFHKARLAHEAAEARKVAEEREAREAAEKAKKDASAAKRAAKVAVLKAEAEKLLARIPAKGTLVTVDGFTGRIFWSGVKSYYGKWSARAGVKNATGEVAWVDAEKFAQ
jgi:hypothetical protein